MIQRTTVVGLTVVTIVMNKNKLRQLGHVIRREEESILRAVMKLNMKKKRTRGRPTLRWLDHIDCHLNGNIISLKEVIGTKC